MPWIIKTHKGYINKGLRSTSYKLGFHTRTWPTNWAAQHALEKLSSRFEEVKGMYSHFSILHVELEPKLTDKTGLHVTCLNSNYKLRRP